MPPWLTLSKCNITVILLLPVFNVAEHSFQVPMPSSPLRLNYFRFGTCFFARVKVNHEKVYSRILAKCVLLPWQWGWFKTRLKNGFCLFKKNPVIRFFSSFAC